MSEKLQETRPQDDHPGETEKTMNIVCAWCDKLIGTKPSEGGTRDSHTICDDCSKKIEDDDQEKD